MWCECGVWDLFVMCFGSCVMCLGHVWCVWGMCGVFVCGV